MGKSYYGKRKKINLFVTPGKKVRRMQMCPECDMVYDESEYSHCPYCSGQLDEDEDEEE